MPAKEPVRFAAMLPTLSLASQLLHGAYGVLRIRPHRHSRRSRLAGEEARKTCIASADAFAGKPAPAWGIVRRLAGVHWRTFRTGCRICTGWRFVWPWL
ncbi:hypothetical protein FW796_22850 [Pseudomonas sp. 910_21]